MLAQVLADDPQARVTALDVGPMERKGSHARYERFRMGWEGPQGKGRRRFILKVPSNTWSEALNPTIPAPSEVLLVEGDLSTVFSQIIPDGAVAAGRKTNARPAWVLSEDFGHSIGLPSDHSSQTSQIEELVLVKSAAFHALHWDALPVLNDVYPWLPRFTNWVEAQCAFLAALLRQESEPDTPYHRWANQQWPALTQTFAAACQKLDPLHLEPLQTILNNPDLLLDTITQSPQTIIHGAWRKENLGLQEGQLIAREWEYVQVGPAAWDLYTYLTALPTASHLIARYLDHVATTIPTLSESERAAFQRAYDLCPLLDTLLHPPRGQTSDTQAHIAPWLSDLTEQITRHFFKKSIAS